MSLQSVVLNPPIRAQCRKQLEPFGPYGEQLESCIFQYSKRWSGPAAALNYKAKFEQLLYNLNRNGEFLTHHYLPAQLVELDDEQLSVDPLSQPKTASDANEHLFALLKTLPKTVSILSRNDPNKIMCKKCGHDDVASYGLQSRSADEGQTWHFQCKKCKNRWKRQ